MSDAIERPVFFEGQILGALDLDATVGYGRDQVARHERYLHTWGIAEGLKLSPKPKQLEINGTTYDYQEIWLSAGLAIDGRGREIVVPEEFRLSESDFDQLNVAINQADALYPVLLRGIDTTSAPSAFAFGDCGASEATRKREAYDIRFSGPGDISELSTQSVPPVAEGPGIDTSNSWMILVGYVSWRNDIKKFTGFAEVSDGVGRRYAGVLADEVVARGNKLLLRTGPKEEAQKPALVLEETTDGPELKFGLLNSAGVVTPLLRVTPKGDVEATGTIKSFGQIYIQSGIASDGLVLPLPAGVTEEEVGPGKATPHIQLIPRITGLTPPTANASMVAAFECEVDVDRRVRCLLQWTELAAPNTTTIVPGNCDYSLIVAVPKPA